MSLAELKAFPWPVLLAGRDVNWAADAPPECAPHIAAGAALMDERAGRKRPAVVKGLPSGDSTRPSVLCVVSRVRPSVSHDKHPRGAITPPPPPRSQHNTLISTFRADEILFGFLSLFLRFCYTSRKQCNPRRDGAWCTLNVTFSRSTFENGQSKTAALINWHRAP